MSNILFTFLKHWKIGGVVILTAAFLISAHLARDRGEKLKVTEQNLKEAQENFRAQIKTIEKARQDEKERNDFRKKQNRKIKLADDDNLRDAYERLRERQRAKIAR